MNQPHNEAHGSPKRRAVGPGGDAPKVTRRPILIPFSDIEPRAIDWLWEGRIAVGRISLIVGMPGAGKSFVSCDMAARVSTGTPWPDGAPCERGDVVLIGSEDDPHDTVRPRLDAHNADVSRVRLLAGSLRTEGDKSEELSFDLADVETLQQTLEAYPDCRLVVIDPIGSFLGARCDAHRDNEVRSVLAPIAALAEKHGVAVVMVAHRRKAAASFADDSALGSRAFVGIARSVWHLGADPQKKGRRLLLPGKSNLAAQATGLAFRIAGEPGAVCWELAPVEMHADDLMAAEAQSAAKKPGPHAEAQTRAEKWLKSALAGGPRRAKELEDEWINGQGGSKRTLERARSTLAVEAFRPVNPGHWLWRLKQDAKSPKGVELGDLGGVLETQGNSAFSGGAEPQDAKLSELGGVLENPEFEGLHQQDAKIAKLSDPGTQPQAPTPLASGFSMPPRHAPASIPADAWGFV